MKDSSKTNQLMLEAEAIRRRLMEIVYNGKAGHIGGDLSCLNILTALYYEVMNVNPNNPKMDTRDRFVLSKGHCVEALYAVLEARGFIDKETVDTYGKFGSPLAGHPTIEVPGVEVNSGALGHGLSIGVGMALAAKKIGASYRTYVLMGDGEQGEGSIYEAAMAASHYHLDNLVAIIDRNKLQISGTTEDVMSLEPMADRWKAFEWNVIETNADDINVLVNTFNAIDYNTGKPTMVIAHTTKGCGVKFMENQLKWHHGVPNTDQYEEALNNIDTRLAQLQETTIV